jgi:hypothetical protein
MILSKLKKIAIVHRLHQPHLQVENPICCIVLQIAITVGEAMKIAKFFRFLRTFKGPWWVIKSSKI